MPSGGRPPEGVMTASGRTRAIRSLRTGRGASNKKAKRDLNFRPRPAQNQPAEGERQCDHAGATEDDGSDEPEPDRVHSGSDQKRTRDSARQDAIQQLRQEEYHLAQRACTGS
jgi:hypothetical protein